MSNKITKGIFGILCTAAIVVFIFRKDIAESKVTKAKLEIFKAYRDNPPGVANEKSKRIIDSLLQHNTTPDTNSTFDLQ